MENPFRRYPSAKSVDPIQRDEAKQVTTIYGVPIPDDIARNAGMMAALKRSLSPPAMLDPSTMQIISAMKKIQAHPVGHIMGKPVNEGALVLEETRLRNLVLAMRLRSSNIHEMMSSLMVSEIEEFTSCHTVYEPMGEKVFIFVVNNGQSVTLEDPAELYPSDALIGQLLMLKDASK
jgi:hypothetical protein